jgi:hypothetical protein
MSNSLSELLRKKQAEPASKKLYFQNNQKLIFELLDAGATYAEVLEAARADGVSMSLRYFTHLVSATKPSSARAVARSAQSIERSTTSLVQVAAAHKPQGKEISPKRAALIAEIERIKSLNISSMERRAMMNKATDDYSKTINPLDRK